METAANPRPGWRPTSSVRFKLALFASIVVLAAGGVPSTFTIVSAHRESRASVDSQLEQLAKLVATGGVFADGGGGIDGRALRAFVNNAAAMRLPVAYVLVEDDEGAIDESLSAVNIDILRELSPGLARDWAQDGREVEVLRTLTGGGQIHPSHRYLVMSLRDVSGTPLGALRVGMSTVEADRRTRHAALSSAAIVGCFLVGALFIVTGAARRLVRPVQRLTSAMTKVAGGDLDQKLAPSSNDEIGQLTATFNEMADGLRQRERLRATLGRYVSHEIAERLLSEADDLDLRGEIRTVSVLFLDMRSFTSLAEKLSPRDVVDLLNAYFDIIVSRVLSHEGIINKFIGDAIMAVWGAPGVNEDAAWSAVKAAWDIQRGVELFNAERMAKGQDIISVGIGINTGQAIAGNVGTAQRLEYTVVGDEVNLAQRLESLAKPGQILISEATYERMGERIQANRMEPVRVKGRKMPVTIYEVVGVASGVFDDASSRAAR